MSGLLMRLHAALLVLLLTVPASAASRCAEWTDWQAFKQSILSADGRVIDASTEQRHTVSEGQAYALFFALAANDRETFARILRWTENNLAAGDLTARLPAWQWGRRVDGNWGVLDPNPASDADLWIAYALGEAGRLWGVRHYRILSALIANRILGEETANIPGLGLSLLPGPVGFIRAPDQWRLNPSYVPVQLLRWLVARDPAPVWKRLLESSLRVIEEPAVRGFAPDWVIYQTGKGFLPDSQTKASGSYNAIRVYLWAGMLDPRDPVRQRLLDRFRPMVQHVSEQGAPPESVDVTSGSAANNGPPGFSGALLPLLTALGETELARAQLLRSRNAVSDAVPAYYDSVLNLFGRGFHEGRFRFSANGRLWTSWQHQCTSTLSHS